MQNNRTLLVAALTLLIGLSFLATNLLSYFVAHDSLSNQITENALPLTSDNVYSEIQRDLIRPVFISSLMANDTFVRDWIINGEKDSTKITKYLEEIQKKYNAVTAFFVSEATRKYYHSTGVLKTVKPDDPQDKWYFRVQQMKKDYEVNVDVDTSDEHSITIFINYRIYDYQQRYVGVVGVGLALDTVKQTIESYQKRYERRIYFVDKQGEITLHGQHFIGTKNIKNRHGLEKLAPQILTSDSGSFTYDNGKNQVFLNSRYVPDFHWHLIVEQEEIPVEERIKNTLLGNLVLAVGITIAVLIGANIILGGYQTRLNQLATRDKLTDALNRQAFDTVFDSILNLSIRTRKPLSLLIADIDDFKNINDSHGHLVGDDVIKAVADTTRAQIRESDVLCRWGGEEFIILLPECHLDEATDIANKIRRGLERREFSVGDKHFKTTASFGVSQLSTNENALSLINRADKALLEAKKGGKNRVQVSPEGAV